MTEFEIPDAEGGAKPLMNFADNSSGMPGKDNADCRPHSIFRECYELGLRLEGIIASTTPCMVRKIRRTKFSLCHHRPCLRRWSLLDGTFNCLRGPELCSCLAAAHVAAAVAPQTVAAAAPPLLATSAHATVCACGAAGCTPFCTCRTFISASLYESLSFRTILRASRTST